MPSIRGYVRNPKFTRYSAAGITAVGAAAIALTVVPGSADAGDHSQATAKSVTAQPAAASADQGKHPKIDLTSAQQGTLDANVQRANDKAAEKKQQAEAKQQAQAEAKQKAQAERKAEAQQKAQAEKKAEAQKKADARKAETKTKSASRSADRPQVKQYPDNLDGWIHESLDIMHKKGIPGSYEGLKRNILRESSGNPQAINNWDINAQKGIPSKGLLQVIPPTFKAYHVDGTSWNIYDPVANITAAANYAADRYGTMDNVDSAY